MAGPKIKDRRRVDDHYARKARAENYPARSVYKLEEIDRKHGLFKPGYRVLDLGCAPGSWTMYASKRVGPEGFVLGVDLNPPTGRFEANVRIVVADARQADLAAWVGGRALDVVLSDMAPKTTGRKDVDQARSAALVETALEAARGWLRPGGSFLFKVFMGPDVDGLMKTISTDFSKVHLIKPRSSRSFSPEIFGLGVGYIKK